jgi:hypothetical protein
MTEHGHEAFGLVDYIAFGARLGLSGMVGLGARFVLAIVELFRLRRAQLSHASNALRAEHERRIARLADATRIRVEKLRALLSLQAQPITSTVGGILGSVLIDRFALACISILTLFVLGVIGVAHRPALFGTFAVLLAWALVHRHLARRRHVDPSAALAERAAHLSKLFPAAFVVMGHTHVPVQAEAGGATYINLGSWAEEELVDRNAAMIAPTRAARTHVVIHPNERGAEAQFRTWEGDGAVKRWSSKGTPS